MRAIDCSCGYHAEAADDEGLVQKMKEHSQQAHPQWRATDERVRQEVAQHAYDVGSKQS
jgi:predicted small metal-binding protein